MYMYLSAFKSDLKDYVNEVRHKSLRLSLVFKGITYREIKGKYNGVEEKSFKVHFDNPLTEKLLLDIANTLEQESVLIVGLTNKAFLKYLDTNEQEYIGMFVEVTKEFAEAQEAYSYDINSGKYYIIK